MQTAGRVEKTPFWAFTTSERPASTHSRSRLPLIAATTLIALAVPRGSGAESSYRLTATDGAFLDQVEYRAVRFFIEHSDSRTGLTRDRAPASGLPSRAPASIAATGFGLASWCIADSHRWIGPEVAADEVRMTLQFVLRQVEQEHGWFYHFIDPETGRRDGNSEVSTIDTALFLQGALFAREYLHDDEVTALVETIYRRIDWQWAMNGGLTLTMGWRPDGGFIPYRWDNYCELMGMYLLGIGASNRALPAASWAAWRRGPRVPFDGRSFIQCGPLFTHQYSHAWFDFRGLRDEYADYWQNSVDATLAQRDWAASQQGRFHHWSSDLWGLTASDSAHGYTIWGTPGPDEDLSDGTLVPCAPAGSLPFAPNECLTALRNMRLKGGKALWGRYGFADAFNPETGWVSPRVIGIDLGITLVMAENLRTGLIWQKFMQAPEVRRALLATGFVRIEHEPKLSPLHFAAVRHESGSEKSDEKPTLRAITNSDSEAIRDRRARRAGRSTIPRPETV